MERSGILIFIVFVMGVLLRPVVLDRIYGEVTVYELHCSVKSTPLRECPANIEKVSKVTYKAYPNTQIVIKTHPNHTDKVFKQCTIFDEKNWRCLRNKQGKDKFDIEMVDGELYDHLNFHDNSKYKIIGYLEYEFRRALHFLTTIKGISKDSLRIILS